MSLSQCDRCNAYQSVRWVDLRSGSLASGSSLRSGNAAQLCLDCQTDVRADVEAPIAADD